MRKVLKKFISIILIIPVKIIFWIKRWLQDKTFLVGRNEKTIIIDYPIWVFVTGWKFIKICWNETFINYSLKKYSKWITIHYSKLGRGYMSYDDLNDKQLKNLYGSPDGRIENFLRNNDKILSYNNGDTFLDAACGRGQNLKVLTTNFPNSLIKVFDIDERALKVVKLGTEDNKNVSLYKGDITNNEFLESFTTNEFDHIIVSHVFSLIISNDIINTRILRQNIISNLIRIAKKTVFIIDSKNILNLENLIFEIEQKQRGFFKESIIPYFNQYNQTGNTSILFPKNLTDSIGVLFKKF